MSVLTARQQAVLDKVRKLQLLAAGSSYAAEANEAIAAAQRLLIAHNLEAADLHLPDPGVASVVVDEEGIHTAWRMSLVHLIAAHFRCVSTAKRTPGGRGRVYRLYGAPTDLAIAHSALAGALAFCGQGSVRYVTWSPLSAAQVRALPGWRPDLSRRALGGLVGRGNRARRLAWCEGFVAGLEDALVAQERTLAASAALVLVVPEDVRAAKAAATGGRPAPAPSLHDHLDMVAHQVGWLQGARYRPQAAPGQLEEGAP